MINSIPQTNGKLERFFRSLEEGMEYYGGMSKYIEYCNERRLYWSLDIDNLETPLKAFHNKRDTQSIVCCITPNKLD